MDSLHTGAFESLR